MDNQSVDEEIEEIKHMMMLVKDHPLMLECLKERLRILEDAKRFKETGRSFGI